MHGTVPVPSRQGRQHRPDQLCALGQWSRVAGGLTQPMQIVGQVGLVLQALRVVARHFREHRADGRYGIKQRRDV